MARHEEEQQRLQNLEATVAQNKKMLTVIMVMAIIVAVLVLTTGIVKLLTPSVAYVDMQTFAKVQQNVETIKDAAIAWQKKSDELQLLLDNSQATAFKTLMIEQEESYQLHLNALKLGMKDLARMVPGSRTWLEVYDEQMDLALAQSKARMNKLSRLQTSELPAIDVQEIQFPAPPVLIEN